MGRDAPLDCELAMLCEPIPVIRNSRIVLDGRLTPRTTPPTLGDRNHSRPLRRRIARQIISQNRFFPRRVDLGEIGEGCRVPFLRLPPGETLCRRSVATGYSAPRLAGRSRLRTTA